MSSKEDRQPAEGRTHGSGRRAATRPVVSDLETSVASAVRAAIAGTLARHAKSPDLPRIDMDFAREPAARVPPASRGGASLVAVVLVTLLSAAAAPALWPVLAPKLSELANSWRPMPGAPRQEIEVATAAPDIPVATGASRASVPEPPQVLEQPATLGTLPEIAPAPETIAGAQAMLARGDVRAARELLRAPAARREIEALLALARSYDPNFLSSLVRSDAAPDVAEAERHYRDWFALSVEAGLISSEVRLDRILRSLRTGAP